MELTTELLRALDNYVAFPVMMLENPVKAKKRPQEKYGWLGEFRWESYGGFEYRTPASWIVGPPYAAAVLCLTKLVVDNYEKLTRNVYSSPETCRLFYQARERGRPRDLRELLWADLEALDDYAKYARGAWRSFPNPSGPTSDWPSPRDIRVRWGLIRPAPRKKKAGRR